MIFLSRPRDVLPDKLRERTTIRSQPLYALTIEICANEKSTDLTPALSNRVLIPPGGGICQEIPKKCGFLPLFLPGPDIFPTHDPLKSSIYIDGLSGDMGVFDPGQPDEQ